MKKKIIPVQEDNDAREVDEGIKGGGGGGGGGEDKIYRKRNNNG